MTTPHAGWAAGFRPRSAPRDKLTTVGVLGLGWFALLLLALLLLG